MDYKAIYCPKCGRKVGNFNRKSKINLITKCKHCNKQVVYFVETGETVAKPLPPRATSSGMTY